MRRTRRLYGPYREKRRRRWRVVIYAGPRARRSEYFASEGAARDFIAEAEAEIEDEGLTVSEALRDYRAHMIARDLKPTTYETSLTRLRSLFGAEDPAVHDLTPRLARKLFRDFAARPIRRNNRPTKQLPRTDHKLNVLAEARRFAKWAIREGLLASDPWQGIEVLGRRGRGKNKLRIDEARKFEAAARAEADAGRPTGVAALAALYLGTRATELVERTVRDLDDDGRIVHLEEAKTAAGERVLEVPDVLRSYLLAMTAGKAGTEPLFGAVSTRHRLAYHVKRLCRVAGVPEVTPHGLRGTHATLARDAGATGQIVAAALGHASEAVTERHYLEAGTVARANRRKAMRVLKGGKR